MKRAIAMQWAEALESGKYEQGKDALRSNEKFCCLGVLCDVYDPTLWFLEDDSYLGSGAYPPSQVRQWAGLASPGGRFNGLVADLPPLIDQNDSGKSFTEIAAVIRQHYEEL